MTYLFLFLLLLLAFFLIVLVLIQRGKGGGLAGAFGGMGGQSAFGTKAGDLFTRITIGVATVWIVVCIVSVKYIGSTGDRMNLDTTPPPAGGDQFPRDGVAPVSAARSAEEAPAAPATTAESTEGATQASPSDGKESAN